MYDPGATLRGTGRQQELPVAPDPLAGFRLALARARKLLGEFLPGMSGDPARLRDALAVPQAAPVFEAERLFLLGWLAWLAGDNVRAEPLLVSADEACKAGLAGPAPDSPELAPPDPGVLAAHAAYWRARVRLLLGTAGAVVEYETALRRLGGQPRATSYYVDLLWRSGRTDRAEQVWRSLRTNKRVQACDEAGLIEARLLLRRGELGPAERLLREWTPAGGVPWTERHLLLVWTHAALRQPQAARDALAQAARGPYPPGALETWRRLVETRLGGQPAAEELTSPGWRELYEGQRRRLAGDPGEASRLYGEAQAVPAVAPFARYGLVCLGEDDPAAVLALPLPAFFGMRVRLRHVLGRFCRREIAPGDWLDALAQARHAGYEDPSLDAYRALAAALQARHPSSSDLSALVESAPPGPARHNALRAALEMAVRLPADEAVPLLRCWNTLGDLPAPLHRELNRRQIRLALLAGSGEHLPEAVANEDEPLLGLARGLLSDAGPPAGEHPLTELWRAAADLSAQGTLDAGTRERLQALAGEGRWRGLAASLLLADAGRRLDPAAAVRTLDDVAAWRGFRPAPPRFVLRVLEALVQAKPGFAGWERLGRWLANWNAADLGPEAGALCLAAGVPSPAPPSPPPGADPTAWGLHQASRALLRGDPRGALAFVRRAEPAHPVLPELQRQAAAAGLAACLPASGVSAWHLTDLVDLLHALPGGEEVLRAAAENNPVAVQGGLAALARRPDAPARLLHHLALLAQRAALRQEQDAPASAAGSWQEAWQHWLRLFASPDAPAGRARELLLDHLLAGHRQRLEQALAQDDLPLAQGYWRLVMGLPNQARLLAPAAAEEVSARVARFRDDLASGFLLSTREAMRFGDVPEGWRADYERGAALLVRLLNLDRDNLPLLTALLETCNDWFLDLYHLQAFGRLAAEVERILPFAERVGRLVEERPGEIAARSALSDIFKVRGFLERERPARVALYREALRLNPGNSNVRRLLADLDAEEEEE